MDPSPRRGGRQELTQAQQADVLALARVLRQLRADRGLSQYEVGRFRPAYVSRLEHAGAAISWPVLVEYLDALGVTVEQFGRAMDAARTDR